MCGITGIISLDPIERDIILKMMAQVHHRGPDGEGVEYLQPDKHSGSYIGLGHNRLSIIDLSEAGHQPMSYMNRYWITYNGEIYNYMELRIELEKKGHTFLSNTDTEVILAAYSEWGEACLSHFNGMFAFLLFDQKNGDLFVARDRFGIKPLYYRVGFDGSIAFASEIKQFTVLNDWKAKMNGQRVYDFLVWGLLDNTDETMFDGVFQIRPGQMLKMNVKSIKSFSSKTNQRLPVQKWYELMAVPFKGSFEDASDHFRELLTDSVNLRLRSDVPVGSCLSGGLDSSSIVVLIHELLEGRNPNNHKSFSACADIERFDERKWIDIVVENTGVDPYYVYPSMDSLFNQLDEITWHQDEPFGSTSIYAQWNVFKLAAENNVKVLLDGQGADEQLVGYHGFFGTRLAGLLTGFRWIQMVREIRALKSLHNYSAYSSFKFLSNALLPDSIAQPLKRFSGRSNYCPAWLNMKKLEACPNNPYSKMGQVSNSLVDMSYMHLTSTNLQMLLHWEDRDSMAHSIEARVPFLDYRLVEQVLGMPDDYKLFDGITKRVLRTGMQNLLPQAIHNRNDKLGFVTPEEVWMRDMAPKFFKEKVREAVAKSGGVLNEFAVDAANKIIDGKQLFSNLPWRLISFGAWIDKFNVAS